MLQKRLGLATKLNAFHLPSLEKMTRLLSSPLIRLRQRCQQMSRQQDWQQHPQDIESQHKVLLTKSNDPIFQSHIHLPGFHYSWDQACRQEVIRENQKHSCCTKEGSQADWVTTVHHAGDQWGMELNNALVQSRATKNADTAKNPQVASRSQGLKVTCRHGAKYAGLSFQFCRIPRFEPALLSSRRVFVNDRASGSTMQHSQRWDMMFVQHVQFTFCSVCWSTCAKWCDASKRVASISHEWVLGIGEWANYFEAKKNKHQVPSGHSGHSWVPWTSQKHRTVNRWVWDPINQNHSHIKGQPGVHVMRGNLSPLHNEYTFPQTMVPRWNMEEVQRTWRIQGTKDTIKQAWSLNLVVPLRWCFKSSCSFSARACIQVELMWASIDLCIHAWKLGST